MAVSMRELLEAGVHFGHQTRRWNPKMRRFIFTERSGIYIIDLTQTSERLDEAAQFVRNLAERNGTILFVGTKKQAQDAVENEAKRVGMPYVNHRWLGGLLTNWRTMSSRRRRISCSRSIRSDIVRQFVSSPPSHRWLTYGMFTRFASPSTASCACFFVPTKRTVPFRSARFRTNCAASSRRSLVCVKSMM